MANGLSPTVKNKYTVAPRSVIPFYLQKHNIVKKYKSELVSNLFMY